MKYTFYTLSWMSPKSKRPVWSIGAAEILAASEAIDEGKTLKRFLQLFFGTPVQLAVLVYSCDLYTSLSARINFIDRSIRADVNCIRVINEVGNVNIIGWLPGVENMADPSTKTDCSLFDALKLILYTSSIPIDLARHESKRFDRSLGY